MDFSDIIPVVENLRQVTEDFPCIAVAQSHDFWFGMGSRSIPVEEVEKVTKILNDEWIWDGPNLGHSDTHEYYSYDNGYVFAIKKE